MSLLYQEKIAKRFEKIKPADFDFWSELDSVIGEALIFKERCELKIWKSEKH